jgi:hypothetical protein
MVNKRLYAMLLLGAGMTFLAGEALALQQWHFVVKNSTSSRIVKLQVSPDKSGWGDFDIGKGIKPGEKATLVWDASTDDQPCKQWIRAKFKDDTYSAPSRQNFCEDLDEPIEFSDSDDDE